MTRLRTATALVPLILVVTACSGDDEPSVDVAHTDPPTASTTSTAAAPPPAEPVSFDSSGRSCAEFRGPTVIWEQIRVRQPLTLRGFDPVGLEGDFEPGATSVVAVPKGEIPLTGSVKGREIPATSQQSVAWDDRMPLPGAEIQPGSYYVFLQGRVRGPGSYDRIDLSWTDAEGVDGTSSWNVHDSYRKKCTLR